MDGTLHPVVQLKFGVKIQGRRTQQDLANIARGNDFIVTIPPDHLQEFTYISGPVDFCNITFIDHTFGRVEQEVFRTDRNEGGALLLRWGYPDNGLEAQTWKHLLIRDYVPTLSSSGLRISLYCQAIGAQYATCIEPKVYRGKISTVVRSIAEEMGYTDDSKVFIEETDDTRRDQEPRSEWFTGNKSRIDFIRQKLLHEAKSLSNPNGTYEFRLGGEGTFEFCTQFFKKRAQEVHGSPTPEKETPNPVGDQSSIFGNTVGDDRGRSYRRFQVLFGVPNGVISFSPVYTTKSIGAYARSTIAGVFDPRTKQFQQSLIDRRTQGMTSDKDPEGGGRTTAAPITESLDKIEQRRKTEAFVYYPVKQVALGGHCSGKQVHDHIGPDIAKNTISSAWRRLHESVNGGTLELVGLPKHAGLSFLDRYVDIAVVLPAQAEPLEGIPEGTNQGLHWSSGRYLIKRITHSITQGYVITLELYRPTALDGPDPARTGPPDETPATITNAS